MHRPTALIRYLAPALLLLLLAASAGAEVSTWNINPEHSSIQFQVRYMGLVNVKGSFDKFQGGVTLDEKNPARSAVAATIASASINTGVAKRDEHLRTDDFFDCPKYPEIKFISKKVLSAGKGKLKIIGDLTMLGQTREVALQVTGPTPPLKDDWGHTRRGAAATARINRKDFGLTWNRTLDAGGLMISDTVDIIIEAELIKTDQKKSP